MRRGSVPIVRPEGRRTITPNTRYDVAISFAGEDRSQAEVLATALTRRGISVFYDRYEKAELWGKNLYTHLAGLYQNQARYCILLLSRHYANKVWTRHEREAAQARAFSENREYILPVRLDETEIPGVLPTTGYLRWPPEDEESIADAVLAKLRQPSLKPTTSPARAAMTGGPAVPSANRSSGDRYCSACGAMPGKPTKCTLGYSHSFVPLTGPMHCVACGAVPGDPTRCSLGYSHSFVPLTGPMHCVACGAIPGNPTKCTLGYSHSFVRA